MWAKKKKKQTNIKEFMYNGIHVLFEEGDIGAIKCWKGAKT